VAKLSLSAATARASAEARRMSIVAVDTEATLTARPKDGLIAGCGWPRLMDGAWRPSIKQLRRRCRGRAQRLEKR